MRRPVKLKGAHAHRCTGCGRRYSDACTRSAVNDVCYGCRTGRPRLETGFDPAPCCVTASKPVADTDTLTRYGLGGDGLWWQCRTCFRTHPFPPADGPIGTSDK